MPDTVVLPDLADLVSYLRVHGWSSNPPGPGGTLWVRDHARIGVPHDPDDVLMTSVLGRLARAERRDVKATADAVRHVRFDVTHLRAVNDFRIVDKIPLETAAKLIRSARTMLRATATTARWERSQIAGNYSRIGDDVIRDAFMGHTERGSFVIPVLVPVPEPERPNPEQPTLYDDDHTEPFDTTPRPSRSHVVSCVRSPSRSRRCTTSLWNLTGRQPPTTSTS